MGNLYGSLKVSLLTDRGQKPVQATHLCYTHLEFLNDSSVYLGECSPLGKYSVDTAGTQLGMFKGCPPVIVLDTPKDFMKTKDRDAPKIVGSCHDIPIELSNQTLRSLCLGLLVLVFGGLFVFGILLLYSHKDSTNEAITQPSLSEH